MTLVQRSKVLRVYVDPGQGQADDYTPPDWRYEHEGPTWKGGRGPWIYNGFEADAKRDGAPEKVYMLRLGEDLVEYVREKLEEIEKAEESHRESNR